MKKVYFRKDLNKIFKEAKQEYKKQKREKKEPIIKKINLYEHKYRVGIDRDWKYFVSKNHQTWRETNRKKAVSILFG